MKTFTKLEIYGYNFSVSINGETLWMNVWDVNGHGACFYYITIYKESGKLENVYALHDKLQTFVDTLQNIDYSESTNGLSMVGVKLEISNNFTNMDGVAYIRNVANEFKKLVEENAS